jgi:hypothetical protein
MFNVDLMSVFYLYFEAECFHRKFDCSDLLKATYHFKHIFEPVLCVSSAHVLFCLQNVFMSFLRFSEYSFDDYTKTINMIDFKWKSIVI